MAQQHILIIDGDPVAGLVTAQGLQRMLAHATHVMTAPSAGAARRYCLSSPLDLLIIDPHPHSQAAAALIGELHTGRQAAIILVLTAYDTPRLRRQMQALGVQHYVAKPVELDQLAAMVNELLGLPPLRGDRQRISSESVNVNH
jgi:two-component system, OmpR family, response regulator